MDKFIESDSDEEKQVKQTKSNNKKISQFIESDSDMDKSDSDTKSEPDSDVILSFDDMECLQKNKGALLKGLYENGFMNPSEIQSKTVVKMSNGVDLIAQARSGSGKTCAFSLGILSQIDPSDNFLQAVVLVHTKELAHQVKDVIDKLSKHLHINSELCVGGTNIPAKQNLDSVRNSHVMIGTPGRISHLLELDDKSSRKNKLFSFLKVFVIDEADKLLNRDFYEEKCGSGSIVQFVPKKCQICLFSATYSREIIEFADKLMNNPTKILIDEKKINVPAINHYKIEVEDSLKYEVLTDIYKMINICQVIIFVNSVEMSNKLFKQLTSDEYAVGVINAKLSDDERKEAIKMFKSSIFRVLISTDLLSRGIDVQSVGLVINYDIPSRSEEYLHRVGRSGRYGKTGVAINFVNRNDRPKILELERKYNIKIEDLPNDPNKLNTYIGAR